MLIFIKKLKNFHYQIWYSEYFDFRTWLTINDVIKEIFDLMEKADYDRNHFFEKCNKLKNACAGLDKENSDSRAGVKQWSRKPTKDD